MNSFNVNNSNRFQSDSVHNVVPAKTNLKKLPVKQVILGSLGLIAIGFVAKSFWSAYNTIPLKPPFGTNHSSHTNSSTTNNSFVNNTCVNILNKNVFPNLNATAEKFVNLPINTYPGENSFAQDFNTVFSQIWESQETKGNDFCEQATVGNLVFNQSTNYNGSNSSHFEKANQFSLTIFNNSSNNSNQINFSKFQKANQFSLNFSTQCEASNTLSNDTIANTEPSIKNVENFNKVDDLNNPYIKEFSQLLHTGSDWKALQYAEQYIDTEDQFSHSFLKYALSHFLQTDLDSAFKLAKKFIDNEDPFSHSLVEYAFSQFLEKDLYYARRYAEKFIGKDDLPSQKFVEYAFSQFLEKDIVSAALYAKEFIIQKDPFSHSLVEYAFSILLEKKRIDLASYIAEKFIGRDERDDLTSQKFVDYAFSQFLEKDLYYARRYAEKFIGREDLSSQKFVEYAFSQFLEKDIIDAGMYAEKFIIQKDPFSRSMAIKAFYSLFKKDFFAGLLHAIYLLHHKIGSMLD